MKHSNYAAYFNDDDLLSQFAKVGNQTNADDPLVLAKFVRGSAAWYIFSFDTETGTCSTYFTWYTNAWFATLSIQDLIMQNALRDNSFISCRLSEIKRAQESTDAFAEQQG